MPSLHYLNPPPHPFWDFVASMEEHPLFAQNAQPPNYASRDNVNNPAPDQAEDTQRPTPEQNEKSKGKQPEGADDPPEVDPSTVRAQAEDPGRRHRGRCGRNRDEREERREERRRGEWGQGWHGKHCKTGRHGPSPFMFGPPGGFGGPWWARQGGPPGPSPPAGPGPHGPHGPHEHHGPPGPHGPPHHHGGRRGHSPPHHPHEHPHHHRGPPPPPGGMGFDLGRFLNNLGERVGVDLGGAANDLGLDVSSYSAPRNNAEADFEPRTDIFDSATNYTIHLSLPGAKKEDVGVDYDGEHSVLRVAGVVHRPGVDEAMLSKLVVDGRKRENGVFEKAIRLGTKRDPASIDVAGITAKMVDDVLVITVPKVEKEHQKREVPVNSTSNSPAANTYEEGQNTSNNNEKDLLFDADEEMYDAPQTSQPGTSTPATKAAPVVGPTKSMNEKLKEKEDEAMRDDRSETVALEGPAAAAAGKAKEDPLPRYELEEKSTDKDAASASGESDWEKDGSSDDEGEYVKINVD